MDQQTGTENWQIYAKVKQSITQTETEQLRRYNLRWIEWKTVQWYIEDNRTMQKPLPTVIE